MRFQQMAIITLIMLLINTAIILFHVALFDRNLSHNLSDHSL